MSTYTNKHSAVVAMLEQARNNHGYNMTDLEEKTGITRSQLYRWMNGDAKNIQQKSFQAVAHNLGYVITNAEDGIEVTHHIQTQGEPDMLQQLKDKERIIALQDDKIQLLETQLKQPNNSSDVMERLEWEHFDSPHLITETQLYFGLQLGRKIISNTDYSQMSQYTGYSIEALERYWALGKRFNSMDDHPISTIITKPSNDKLKSFASQILSAYELLRSMLSSKPITVYVDYIAKNKSIVKSASLCKINWYTKIVTTKTLFICCEDLD